MKNVMTKRQRERRFLYDAKARLLAQRKAVVVDHSWAWKKHGSLHDKSPYKDALCEVVDGYVGWVEMIDRATKRISEVLYDSRKPTKSRNPEKNIVE